MRAGLKAETLWWAFAAIATVLMLSTAAFGQCSMCRTALSGSNSAFIRNFNIGVLVLLVPPVAIFCSMFVVLKRYKVTDDEHQTKKDSQCSSSESD